MKKLPQTRELFRVRQTPHRCLPPALSLKKNRTGLPKRGPVPFRQSVPLRHSPPVLMCFPAGPSRKARDHLVPQSFLRPGQRNAGKSAFRTETPSLFARALYTQGKRPCRRSLRKLGTGLPERRPDAERTCIQRRLPRGSPPRAVPLRRHVLPNAGSFSKSADRAPLPPDASDIVRSDSCDSPDRCGKARRLSWPLRARAAHHQHSRADIP